MNAIDWFEDLPDKCPPDDAINPDGRTFYRLTNSDIPSDKDFLSLRELCPSCKFRDVSECIARSLSIWEDVEKCLNLLKLPRHKDKKVLTLKLEATDGLILQTFKKSHYSWWRTKSFDFSTFTKSE
jgi:hypothetical protein